MPEQSNWVCDSCYKVGRCNSWPRCTCPCTRDGWNHADDPNIIQEFELEEGIEY